MLISRRLVVPLRGSLTSLVNIDFVYTLLVGRHGTFLRARIAERVQHLANRDALMALALAQNFLQILDILVDMGDRRSAALQLGEVFREIRITS